MTAQVPATTPGVRASGHPFLGFGTFFRKELQDWMRARRALIVGIAAVVIGVLAVLVPIIVKATDRSGNAPVLSLDPTDNVLFGWGGTTPFEGFLVILATISLMTLERDRGTLAWSLSKPLSRTSVLLAKWIAAFVVLTAVTIVLPMVIQVVVATIAYGAVPNLATVASFGFIYLGLVALYLTLTLAAGTVIPSTAGVAGVAFLVMFVAPILAGIVPALADIMPMNYHLWAQAVVAGDPWTWGIPIATLVTIVTLATGAKLAFDRQDF